jgi:uncharacterized protein YdgA (DUF945 family)
MKKLFTVLSVPVVLAVAWGASSWYIGQQTESSLRNYIEQNNKATVNQGVKQELVSYEKTLFGAKAVTKLNIDEPPFNKLAGNIQFINEVHNGPVFFDGGSPVQFGSSRITTHLDMDALDKEQRQWLETAFAGKPPLEGQSVIGFGGGVTYDFSVNPMKMAQDGSTFVMDGATLSGTADADMTGPVKLHVSKLDIKDATSQFTLPSVDVDGNITGLVGDQALGTFDIKAPQVSVLAEGATEPFVFDMAIQSASDVKNADLEGKIALQMDNVKGANDALSKLQYSMDFKGLGSEGVKEISKVQAEMQNAISQTSWNADAMETPEGQQKQQELMDKVNKSSEQIIAALFGKVLKTDKSRIHSVLMAESPKGKLNADIDLTYTGKAAPAMMELASYGANDWAKMMKGTVKLDADKALLPAGMDMLATPYIQQGLLTQDGAKFKSDVILAGENVTLNGKQMLFADLVKLLAPDMGGMPGADTPNSKNDAANIGIPEDLMKQIQEKGLTPETMQLLEESDDVSPETVEMLKNLQQLQQGEKEGKLPEEATGKEPAKDKPAAKTK